MPRGREREQHFVISSINGKKCPPDVPIRIPDIIVQIARKDATIELIVRIRAAEVAPPVPVNYDRETSVSLLFTSFTIHLLSKWFIRNGPPDVPNRTPDNIAQIARKEATKELTVRIRAV